MIYGQGPPNGTQNGDGDYGNVGIIGGLLLAFWFGPEIYQMFVDDIVGAGVENYGYQFSRAFEIGWFWIAHLLVFTGGKLGISTGVKLLSLMLTSRMR